MLKSSIYVYTIYIYLRIFSKVYRNVQKGRYLFSKLGCRIVYLFIVPSSQRTSLKSILISSWQHFCRLFYHAVHFKNISLYIILYVWFAYSTLYNYTFIGGTRQYMWYPRSQSSQKRSLSSFSEVPHSVHDLHSIHCHGYLRTLTIMFLVNCRHVG